MKRVFALTMALVMTVALLSGCNSKKQTDVDAKKSSSGSSSSSAAEFQTQTWRMALSASQNSVTMKAAQYFGEQMKKETNGAVTIEFYPSDQLTQGNQANGVQELIEGNVDLSLHSNLTYASFDPRFNVISLPFLFDSVEDADAKLQDGGSARDVKNLLDSSGLHCLGIGEDGFRYLTNNKKAVATVADLKGLNIRVGSSEMTNRIYQLWGATTAYADWPEVFTALKTGKYDGQESALITADASSIQTVQKYVTKMDAVYDCLFLCMNKDLYESLTPALQDVADKCGKKAMSYQRKLCREQNDAILTKWKSAGVTVTEPTEDAVKEFKKASKPAWKEFEAKLTPKLVTAFTKE